MGNRRLDISQLLEKLDFNSLHCGDPIARAYFGEAAIALRMIEGERDHYQHAAAIERSNAYELRKSCRELEGRLAALANPPEEDPPQKGIEHDG